MAVGKTVLITGASSGIGEACARLFAREGWTLLLTARRAERLETLARDLVEHYGVEVRWQVLDVREKDACFHFLQAWGDPPVDVLINNAGLARGLSKLVDNDPEDWDAMIDTNVKGLLWVTRTVVKGMIERGLPAHVVNIGSIAGTQAYPNGAVYCASKAAVKFLSDGLRMDVVEHPIRVTNIQPGLVETEFSVVRFAGDESKAKSVYEGIVPLSGDDVANAVWYAVSAPGHVQVAEITLLATHQASATVVHRKV
jgi:NADP-dependent 3-hydroxy acid dehydrogenase YdfG